MKLVLGQLSLSMEEGTIVRWVAADGSRVESGQVILEVETDKATADVEAPVSGVLKIVATGGQVVAVGGPLAEIDEGDGH